MKDLVLILWIILWPLSFDIGLFFTAKTKALSGIKQWKENEWLTNSFIGTVIWIGMWIVLANR